MEEWQEPHTTDLLNELRDSPSIDDYASRHYLKDRTVNEYLEELLDEKGLTIGEVGETTGLGYTYVYRIVKPDIPNPIKDPSRDRLLMLAFGMGLDLRETKRVLEVAGKNPLYPKSKRDSIILLCIRDGLTLAQANEQLTKHGEPTLPPDEQAD